jgi:hypothetical protein
MMMGQSMLESTLSINQTESSAETLEIPDLISKLQEIISDEESAEQLDCDKLQDIIADLEGMLEE